MKANECSKCHEKPTVGYSKDLDTGKPSWYAKCSCPRRCASESRAKVIAMWNEGNQSHFRPCIAVTDRLPAEREECDDLMFRLAALVREVTRWHRDKQSADYNECEKSPCRWCEKAQKAIDELVNMKAEGLR